jgi:protein O-GlcNAc transferase
MTDAQTIQARATDLIRTGDSRAALALLDDALARAPHDAALIARRADALHAARRLDEARAAYADAIQAGGDDFAVWFGRGSAELALKAHGAAACSLAEAVRRDPWAFNARLNLASAQFHTGEIEAAIDHLAFVLDKGPRAMREVALANIACIIPGDPRATNQSILDWRRAWITQVEAASPKLAGVKAKPRAGERPRIGYVSSFFGDRNWMKPVWGAINQHDRAAFQVHLFADASAPSEDSGYRAHPDDRVHHIGKLSNQAAAELIAQCGIDILVDLNGYSAQRRLGMLVRRPAPIVVAWFGMYATTGSAAYDYTIADAASVPDGEDIFCAEKVLRVPGSYLGFEVRYQVPDEAPPPCLINGHITFGSFCSQYKFADSVVAAWSEILQRAPEARLIIRNRAMGDDSSRAALRGRFARHGVEARVTLAPGAEHYAFLEGYAAIDVALDTFPYNGGTTTIEAVWQGVPVLTFNGDRWASRTSRSILLPAGLDAWVAPSLRAYIDQAIALASDPATPERLAKLRGSLREQLAGSPVCDTRMLARALEDLYAQMLRD